MRTFARCLCNCLNNFKAVIGQFLTNKEQFSPLLFLDGLPGFLTSYFYLFFPFLNVLFFLLRDFLFSYSYFISIGGSPICSHMIRPCGVA